jgi:hypothetical protein
MGGLAMGYIRDFEDPMRAINDDAPKEQYDFAALTKNPSHANADFMDSFRDEMVNAETPSVSGGVA